MFKVSRFAVSSIRRRVEITSLSELTIDNNNVDEGTPEDTLIGVISGYQGGSTLSLLDDFEERYKIINTDELVRGPTALDYELNTFRDVVVIETAGAETRQTTFRIFTNNVDETPVNITPPTATTAGGIGDTYSLTSNGTWTYDPSGYLFQLYKDGTNPENAVEGETSGSYIFETADIGSVFRWRVEAVGDDANGYAFTTATTAVAGIAPNNTIAPTISGLSNPPEVGETASVNIGTWDGVPTPVFTYQWKLDGVDIPDAELSTYAIQFADIGEGLSCAVTGTNSEGSDTASTTQTADIVDPGATEAPTLSDLTITSTGTTTAIWEVTTDQGTGNIYGVGILPTETAPDVADIIAGTDGASVAADWASGAVPVASIDTYEASITGLTDDVIYKFYFFHRNAYGLDSDIVSAVLGDPLIALFAGGAGGGGYDGAYHNIQRLDSLWSNAGRTTPATVNGNVRVVDDLSGNARHLSFQSGGEWVLRQSGSIYYLEANVGASKAGWSANTYAVSAPHFIAAVMERPAQDGHPPVQSYRGTTQYHRIVGRTTGFRTEAQIRESTVASTVIATGNANLSTPLVCSSLMTQTVLDNRINLDAISSVAAPWGALVPSAVYYPTAIGTPGSATTMAAAYKYYGLLAIKRDIGTSTLRDETCAQLGELAGLSL